MVSSKGLQSKPLIIIILMPVIKLFKVSVAVFFNLSFNFTQVFVIRIKKLLDNLKVLLHIFFNGFNLVKIRFTFV